MLKKLDDARSDAMAICACLGPLAMFAMEAEMLATAGADLSHEEQHGTGERMLAGAADALSDARQKLDALMQEFGEYFNGVDAVSGTVSEVTEPVFELLRKRTAGVSLND